MLDLKEERKFRELRKLGRELHIPILESFVALEVFDKQKHGRCIQRLRQRSHTWVENGYNEFFQNAAAVGNLAADNLDQYTTAGVQKTNTWANFFTQTAGNTVRTTGYGYRGAAGSNTYGIVVGSGNDPEVFDSSQPRGYSLETIIANGAGAGQLAYTAQDLYVVTFVALVKKATLVRYFNNNSGGDVVINEVALYGRFTLQNGVDQPMMVSRDLLAAIVTLPNTGQLRVTYVIQMTYPA